MNEKFPIPSGVVMPSNRVSDEQRDAVCDLLIEHYALGRISHEELERRTELALSTDVDRQLARVTSDLPMLPGHRAGPGLLRILGWVLGAIGTGVIAAALTFIGLGMLVFGAAHWWTVIVAGLVFAALSTGSGLMARRDARRRRR